MTKLSARERSIRDPREKMDQRELKHCFDESVRISFTLAVTCTKFVHNNHIYFISGIQILDGNDLP